MVNWLLPIKKNIIQKKKNKEHAPKEQGKGSQMGIFVTNRSGKVKRAFCESKWPLEKGGGGSLGEEKGISGHHQMEKKGQGKGSNKPGKIK